MLNIDMTDPLIGQVLKDAYRIDSALADGGMGVVYIAEQLSLARKVVLKVLRPSFNDEDFIELFLREARINSQINHPNVVSVFDFGRTEENLVYMAMEYLDGQTLNDIVQAQNGLPLAKCMWVLEQVCSAVHAAHKINVVHRDIKPNNVMVSTVSGDTMVAKILDFGISKPLEEQDLKHTQMGMVMGTPGYLSPEQIAGQRDIDIRADIYALGALLYFMMTGHAPYRGSSCQMIMNKQLTSPPIAIEENSLLDKSTAVLIPVILKAMSNDREDRYHDVNEFWQAVLQYANNFNKVGIEGEQVSSADTLYRFVFKGETSDGYEQTVIREKLKKGLKFNDQQTQALFSGRRVIIRKNLSRQSVDKIAGQFKQIGAVAYIEEMPTETRLQNTEDETQLANSLPSIGMTEAISLSDIQSAAHRAEIQKETRIQSEESRAAMMSHNLPSGNNIKKLSKKGKAFRILVSIFMVMVFTLLAASYYPPIKYPLSDFVWHSIKNQPQMRGVSSNEIKIGMSAAFSGSAREIGQAMRVGVNAYFKTVNETGGVHGRQLKLLDLDDGYEPEKALSNIDQFLDKDAGVFALLGNVGTPTAKAILDTVLEHKMVQFGTFSGSGILRNNPPDRYIFNYRASYAEETAALIHYFVGELEIEPRKIAVFYQNDSYGMAGLMGVEEALHQYHITKDDIVKASYQRNTSQVNEAVERLYEDNQNIEAVISVSTYAASAAFIKAMRDKGYEGKFANVSFVGSRALAERLQEMGQSPEGVIISQVVPLYSSYATGVLAYREALNQYYPGEAANFISLEGYIIAQIFVEALNRTGRHLDSERLVNALETLTELDLGIGTSINFSLSDHQGNHRVWGTELTEDYRFEAITLEVK